MIKREFFYCDTEKIVPNTYQPRKIFQKEALDELVESIKIHGIIQPIVVRHRGGNFELVAGERRWRAAQKAGLRQVPVVIRDIEDQSSLEMALIENLQRQDLNCIEEAIAYQQLVDEFHLTQEQVATRVGKSRVAVTNTIRLLKLPAVIREDITSGKITMGHARALLALESTEDQLAVREEIIKKKLSVRDAEKTVNEILKRGKSGATPEKTVNIHLLQLEKDLQIKFGATVRIVGNETRGFFQISYGSKEDLMRIADLLKDEVLVHVEESAH